MPDFKTRLIDHLVWMASLDKAYAWWAAKNYASMHKDFEDVPQLLTAAMQSRKSKEHLTGGRSHE